MLDSKKVVSLSSRVPGQPISATSHLSTDSRLLNDSQYLISRRKYQQISRRELKTKYDVKLTWRLACSHLPISCFGNDLRTMQIKGLTWMSDYQHDIICLLKLNKHCQKVLNFKHDNIVLVDGRFGFLIHEIDKKCKRLTKLVR